MNSVLPTDIALLSSLYKASSNGMNYDASSQYWGEPIPEILERKIFKFQVSGKDIAYDMLVKASCTQRQLGKLASPEIVLAALHTLSQLDKVVSVKIYIVLRNYVI
jgi:hypothetical protein